MIPRVAAWSRHRKIKVIGAGGSGQVFLARPTTGEVGVDCVVKRVFVDDNIEQAQCAAAEVEVLQSLPLHPNVVGYLEHYFDDEGYFNIALQYCPDGDLEKLINDRSAAGAPLSLEEAAFLTLQLLCGVRCLHRHHVVHRDIKPGNLFLAAGAPGFAMTAPLSSSVKQPLDLKQATLKIADFGISRVMQTGSYATTVVGTPYYIPPEICESQPYTASADLWAVGCVIYELCTLSKLFGGTNMLAVVRAIAAAKVPPLPAEYAPLDPLVRALVRSDAGSRMSADEAISTFFAPRLLARRAVAQEQAGSEVTPPQHRTATLGRFIAEEL